MSFRWLLTLALLTALLLATPWLTLARSQPQHSQPAAMHKVIVRVFGPHWRTAECIARAESNLDPKAVSRGGGNWGLFQMNVIHRSWLDWTRILQPLYNTRAAYRLSKGGRSWQAWTTRGLCGA